MPSTERPKGYVPSLWDSGVGLEHEIQGLKPLAMGSDVPMGLFGWVLLGTSPRSAILPDFRTIGISTSGHAPRNSTGQAQERELEQW